jgi:hypothetical protein
MNSLPRAVTRVLLVGVLAVLSLTAAWAQVNVDINLPNYDVIYATDMFDVTTGSFANAVPNLSFNITTSPPRAYRVWMTIVARVQLQGDPVAGNLVSVKTQVFDLNQSMVISSRELAAGRTSTVPIFPGDVQRNRTLETRIRDHILKFPTAPVGNYTIDVSVFDGTNGNSTGARLGGGSRTVQVRNSSAGDVNITLLEPQDGASVNSLLPTFSWTTEKPRARLKVYEKLPHHQSAQEAVTGIPHLSVNVETNVFNYPPDARKLETGKTYYWFVEALVSTNRGDEVKQSEIRAFRIQSANMTALSLLLERLLSTYGADLAPVLVSMQSMGLQLTGDVTLDGGRVTREELARLFDSFVTNQTKLSVRIE